MRHWNESLGQAIIGNLMLPPLLISVRHPNDSMTGHEKGCFEKATGLELELIHAMTTKLDRSWLEERPFLLCGGSGDFGVQDPHPWIHRFLDFLLDAIDLKVPSYASCFGFQGVALALGGEIGRDPEKQEMGVIPLELTSAGEDDPLFSQLSSPFHAPLGHNDEVTRLPAGVTLLACGDLVTNQAFRVNNAPFWASQFHPELTRANLVQRWEHYRDQFTTDKEIIQFMDSQLEASPEVSDVHLLLKNLLDAARPT